MTPVLVQVAPPPRQGLAPLVKLWFDLEFDTATRYGDPAAATKDHGEMRALIAAEWSMLARFAATTTEAERDTWTPARRLRLEAAVKTMSENVGLWLLNHTDLSKGEAMLDDLVQRHLAVPADQLAGKLRDALDKRLIIANHWGQNEEDLQLEAHQRVLSDLFGTLHHSIARVSPVAIMREVIAELLHLDMREEAALALQYGVGHCQEHANVSFAALKGIKDGGSPEVTDIILSGFSNIDHAFVVFNMPIASGPKDGLTPAGVWITTTTTWARDKAQRNQIALLKGKDAGDKVPLSIWNLTLARQAERQRQQQQPDPRGIGRVLDPYLSSTGRTAAELETALGKMPAHQGTTWLWVKFYEGHPVIVQANGKAFSDFRVSVPGKRDDVDRSFPREDFFPNV